MKYYSDTLKALFDTEEALLSAEETARQQQESKKLNKAKLAKAVEDAEKEIEAAYKILEDATKQVTDIQKEYDKKVDEIMNPANENLQKCLKKRAEAIKAFNDKYGAYTTTYTGNKALNEFYQTMQRFDKLLNFWF